MEIEKEEQKKSIYGAVEKGPFVRGSVVTIEELNTDLSATGRTFKSEIQDDKGSFSIDDITLVSDYVRLSVNGYYFNEVTGELSSSQITLNAVADIRDNQHVNVNILSHLEEKRVKSLVKKEKKNFSEAKQQALGEIYKAFFVKNTPTSHSGAISLTQSNHDANVLLGISATLLSIAQSDNARLTELLSTLSTDLEDNGLLEDVWTTAIASSLQSINPQNISRNVKNRYADLNTIIPDFKLEEVFTIKLQTIERDEFFKKEEDFIAAYNSLVQSSVKMVEQYVKMEGLYSKTITGLPQNLFYQHQIAPSNSDLYTLFSSAYQNIRRALVIMDHARQSSDPNLEIYAYKSYPHFAYTYWILMNFWGDTPFLNFDNYNNITNQSFPRITKKNLSQELIAGLDEAIANLGLSAKDLDVARAVAAKIAVDNADYTAAKVYVDAITQGAKYTLAPTGQIHSSPTESILGFTHSEATKPDDYDTYAKGEYRNVIRYTEVVLLASELSLKLNQHHQAIALLNQVRVRNGKSVLSNNENDVLRYIQEEVKDDLKNEGIYFAFLKRNNLATSVLEIATYQQLLPIPAMEIMLNPYMTQNPGY